MPRWLLPGVALALAALVVHGQTPAQPGPAAFSVVEASIDDMRLAMEQGRVTSREIVTQSLVRIATYEDRLNAAITINPRALAEADERDRERRAGRVRGPLHGIPVALKDNIHTIDMRTTGGALAFAGLVPPYEATLARNLREAGAIVIAKTVMTELANWVSDRMPTNYGSLAGFAFNPYDPRRDPREATGDGRPVLATGGSSSGIGTAASFWAANVGTETSGSILSPANQNMLVGIKPTVGRVSRHGVIPITADQDTPGPMARSVVDAALLLGALEGRAPDTNDLATRACAPPPQRDYTRTLRRDGLAGARIGIPRAFYYEPAPTPNELGSNGGLSAPQRGVMDEAIAVLRALRARRRPGRAARRSRWDRWHNARTRCRGSARPTGTTASRSGAAADDADPRARAHPAARPGPGAPGGGSLRRGRGPRSGTRRPRVAPPGP
jgi:amidase